MPNISIQASTALSFLGLLAVVLGIFLILGGAGIVSPAVIQIVPGRRTLIAGLVLTVLGMVAILPEVLSTPRPTTTSATTASPTDISSRSTDAPIRSTDTAVPLKPTTASSPTVEPLPPIQTATLTSPSASSTFPPSSRVLLGTWEYQGNRPSLPPPAGSGQIIFANGDINNSGMCYVKEFGSGELVQNLGDGRFQLWLITGTPEQIAAHKAIIQEGSAKDPNNPFGTCPDLP